MANYSKEGSKLKIHFRELFDKWDAAFYEGNADKPAKNAANPTGKGITRGRAMRGLNSLIMSPDEVHLNYVDNRLAKGATIKSIMGGLGGRVQGTSQGSTSPFAPVPTDSLHHKNVLAAYEPITKQKANVLHDFLKISEDQGEFYGDSEGNLKGHSTDARAHTGGRGKKGKSFNPTAAGAGIDGDSKLSMHPRGTADPTVKLENKQFSSGKEMFDAAANVRKTHANDLKVGTAADTPRRNTANSLLIENGIIEKGSDVFSSKTSEATIRKANKFFQGRKDLLSQVAEAFDPKLAKNVKGMNFNAVMPWTDYIPVVDEMTGGHVDKGLQKGVNWLRNSLGIASNPIQNNYAK